MAGGNRTMTTEASETSAVTLSHTNATRHVIIFSWTVTTACCSAAELWLDLVSGWLVVMPKYF